MKVLPTAYDTEKVIELINVKIEAWEDKSFLRRDIVEKHVKAWKSALSIVKGGGNP